MNWLGVVSARHVARAVELGIAQIGHGKLAGLRRMHTGDTLVYYSPMQDLGDRSPLRAFTALGEIADAEIWQADEGDFHPYRRAVRYATTRAVPLAEVHGALELTGTPNWGYQLRRGLVPLSDHDVGVLTAAMVTG